LKMTISFWIATCGSYSTWWEHEGQVVQ
jgi:hypothetical protein